MRDASPQVGRRPLDYGFFGPDSVRWKVALHPASFTVAGLRTGVVEMFDPFVLAAVADTGAVLKRSASRYERSVLYEATISFGDSEQVLAAAEVLTRIHGRIRGIEPVSGNPYDAGDPAGQLWILLTEWQSVLLCYELFGPGKLSPDEDRRYWGECRRAAEFQTIDPETVPGDRDGVRAYYERVRPRLAATDATVRVVTHYLDSTELLLAGLPPYMGALVKPGIALAVRRATIASMPRWMRRMAGIRQSAAEDAAAIAFMRSAFRAFPDSPRALHMVLRRLLPDVAEVVGPRLLGVEPLEPVVRDPAATWEAAGKRTPRKRYADQLADRGASPAKAPADPGPNKLLRFA